MREMCVSVPACCENELLGALLYFPEQWVLPGQMKLQLFCFSLIDAENAFPTSIKISGIWW